MGVSMNIIDSFLLRYAKEYDFYQELAYHVASTCESIINRNGIRAIVTYRAKKPDSLREKLIKRNSFREYESIDQIYKDIVDLAGVRIAIYFPGDREEIGKLIEAEFLTEKTKSFPNAEPKSSIHSLFKKRFAGYDAIHYRVRIKEERLEENQKRFSHAQVEIQIASALMHAWAEVEHDLAYKPQIGSISEDEFNILDELNGMVLSGEIALERLQKAFKYRISTMEHQFNNHYELAALIRQKAYGNLQKDQYMGRADILFKFLQKVKMDTPKAINPYLVRLNENNGNEYKAMVDRFVDMILSERPELYKQYLEAKYEVNTHNPYIPLAKDVHLYEEYKTLSDFIDGWVELRKTVNEATAAASEGTELKERELGEKIKGLIKSPMGNMEQEIKYLYNLRNHILFGSDIPDPDVLVSARKIIDKINNELIE